MQKVYACRVKGYDDPSLFSNTEKIIAEFAKTHPITAKTKILLKPNLVSKNTPEKAATTHPEVVRAVIRALKKQGAVHITLADSCGGTYNGPVMRGVYTASGMKQVCEEEGILLYEGFEETVSKNPNGLRCHEFAQLLPVAQADYVINLPKLKTHEMAGITCAVKNLYGTIPGLLKAELHMRFPDPVSFGNMLVDLCETVKPALSIADGIMAMEGDGPTGGDPRFAGILAAGENPYYLDLYCCHLIGIDPRQVPYLAAAQKRGLCPQDFSEEWYCGEAEAKTQIEDFKKPESYTSFDFSDHFPIGFHWLAPIVAKWLAPHPVIQKKKCIGCGRCAVICPQKVITIENKKAHINPQNCIRCFCCHEMCPEKAIDVRRYRFFHL